MENRIIGQLPCEHCGGAGTLPDWLAPPPCKPDCVETLREYPQEENDGRIVMYWLCDNGHWMPTLWRAHQRTRCIAALTEAPRRASRRKAKA